MTVASKFPKFLSNPKFRAMALLTVAGGIVGYGSGSLIGKLEKGGALSLQALGWSG